jgi:hypothetical protein
MAGAVHACEGSSSSFTERSSRLEKISDLQRRVRGVVMQRR